MYDVFVIVLYACIGVLFGQQFYNPLIPSLDVSTIETLHCGGERSDGYIYIYSVQGQRYPHTSTNKNQEE